MTIYDELQQTAREVLGEFRQGTIKLISLVPGTGPDDEPGVPTETLTELEAVVRGLSYKYMKEGFSVATDFELTAAVVDGVTPSIHDYILVDDIRYKIVQDIPVPSAGTRCVWKFIIRKGG